MAEVAKNAAETTVETPVVAEQVAPPKPVEISKEEFNKLVDVAVGGDPFAMKITKVKPQVKLSKADLRKIAAEAPVTITVKKAKDQKSAPAKDQKDQKDAPKKKGSANVFKWKAQGKFELNQKITVPPEHAKKNPKSKGAAVRFALYKTGMTVQGYINILKEKKLGTAASGMNDMRWDVAAGFISIK